jgi:hypothetical protein
VSNASSKQSILALALCGATLLGAASMNAQAAGVSVTGINDLNGLFGSSTFDSNTNRLVFTPAPSNALDPIPATNFLAAATGTSPFSVVFDTLTLSFTADPGFTITSIDVFEVGTFGRIGNSANTFVGGSITINNGAAQGLVVSPNGASGSGNAELSVWDVGLTNPLHMAVGGSVANIVWTNVLGASANGGSTDIAVVFKRAAMVQVNTAPVPVPPALMMFGPALLALTAIRRRNSRDA